MGSKDPTELTVQVFVKCKTSSLRILIKGRKRVGLHIYEWSVTSTVFAYRGGNIVTSVCPLVWVK